MQIARLKQIAPLTQTDGRSASLVIALAMLGVLAMQPLSAVLSSPIATAPDSGVAAGLMTLSRAL